MQVSFQPHADGKQDGLVFFTTQGAGPAEKQFQERFGESLKVARTRKEFSGKKGEVFVHTLAGELRFVAIAGVGESFSAARLREAAGEAARTLHAMGAERIALEVPPELSAAIAAQAVTEGAMLSTYQYLPYRTENLDEIKRLDSLTIVSNRSGVGARSGVERAKIIAECCNYVRDLQNTPSCDMTPADVAHKAAELAKQERLKIKTLDRRALEKQGFAGILAVGKGSVADPRLVTMEYAPKKAKRTIALVGKGVTFDAGGISLKPSSGMGEMKFDMSGAASVLGVMRAASRLKADVRIIGILGLAENMPSGSAFRPGDIVRTKSGKTIEIENTDAEGRVVLADCLTHAVSYAPDLIVDVATLTGAAIVALGDAGAAMLGTDEKAITDLQEASEFTGEKFWRLPLWEEYEEDIKSSYADMKNMGAARIAGAIVAALILKRFVGDVPWVHLDIAGTAWTESHGRYFTAKGAGGTAYGVRLLTEFLTKDL